MEQYVEHQLIRLKEEKGQSIITLALAVVMLLTFVGLTMDMGWLHSTRIQLSRSVAAALTRVMESPDEAAAQARQFIRTNDIDPDEANMAMATGGSAAIGQSNFMTVTSPIEIYASQHSESGVTGAVNLSVFGRDSNPQWGDAFMGTHWSGEGDCHGVTPSPNPYWGELEGKYPFRIHVPADYVTRTGTSEIQVEILDPDCWNTAQNYFDIPWVVTPTIDYNMPANNTHRGSVAVVKSNDPNNPLWQVRMDQYHSFCYGEPARP